MFDLLCRIIDGRKGKNCNLLVGVVRIVAIFVEVEISVED